MIKIVMGQMTVYTIGADVDCTDGVCGEVRQVVVDPVARAVTHLVVKPKAPGRLGRLVPLGLVDATTVPSREATGDVRLRCTLAAFDKLDGAEETQFLPGKGGYGYGAEQVLSWPYFGMGAGTMGLGMGSDPATVTYDTLPLGEVAVRRGEQVHATDGDIGRVEGLIIDSRSHHVTHVLLQEGHLWGRKQVAIPISAVTEVIDGVGLNLTKHDVHDLPPVEVDHPNG
jgi:sporulation protein YlmC with PRC-barrel domain